MNRNYFVEQFTAKISKREYSERNNKVKSFETG